MTSNSMVEGLQAARISTGRFRPSGVAFWMALLQASVMASSQAERSGSASDWPFRNRLSATRAAGTSDNSQGMEMRKVTSAGALMAGCDMRFCFDDLKDAMEPGEFEELLHRWAGIDQPKGQRAVAAIGEFVEGDQRAEPATVHKLRFREIDLDGLEVRRNGGGDLFAKALRIRGGQLLEIRDCESFCAVEYFHCLFCWIKP